MLEAKLFAGGSGYDIAVPSASPFMARQIAARVYKELDKAALPTWKNLDPRVLELVAAADPGNAHGVPYPNPNLPATALVERRIRDDPAIYPPADVHRRFFVDLPAPADYERARTRAWTRLKSGY